MHTILIVEDNKLNLKLFTDIYEANGYKVLYSVDGSDAIDIAREHKPDLIQMDVQLSGRLGTEITKQLKADDSLKHIPVIAVTAFAMTGDEEKFLAAGCDGYISKPISVPSFLTTIKNHLPD